MRDMNVFLTRIRQPDGNYVLEEEISGRTVTYGPMGQDKLDFLAKTRAVFLRRFAGSMGKAVNIFRADRS